MGSFKKATKEQAKLRLALFGVSGSGKTYTALRIATGLGGKIAVIDTERNSACKYSDRFDFDVCDAKKPSIENLKMFIDEARDYDVLIIDSMTHAWLELLQEVEKLAKTKFGGNTWSAWSEGTPKQMSLINALLDFPGHIIATMRVETNWTTVTNEKGKVVPVRVGEAPKQGKGIEYEFDMLMQISPEHDALVIKDRTGKYQDEVIQLPDEQFGKDLAEWLKDGKAATKKEKVILPPEDEDIDEDTKKIMSGGIKASLQEDIDEMEREHIEEKCISITPEEVVETSDQDIKDLFKKKCFEAGLLKEDIKFFAKRNNIKANDVNSILEFLKNNDLQKKVIEFKNNVEL